MSAQTERLPVGNAVARPASAPGILPRQHTAPAVSPGARHLGVVVVDDAGIDPVVDTIAETWADFKATGDRLLREQRMGVSFEEALAHLEKRLPVEEFRLFTAGLRIARSVGGNLSEILESLAHTLTRKAEVEGKIRSLTAQGKIQGLVMTLLPVLLMFVLRAMEPKPMALLFHSLIGWVVLAIVAIMEVLGYVFIRKIVTIEI